MKVTFLGTGEAFGKRANTSILIDDSILLDCGMHTLQQLMKLKFPISDIKLIWISHLHADHVFGLPAFLCASIEEKRREDVKIVTCFEIKDYVKKLIFLAYRKKLSDFDFKIDFINLNEISKNSKEYNKFKFEDYIFKFAENMHSIPSFAVSITDDEGKKVTYTGDGAITQKLASIAENSDLIIAEGYLENTPKHSSISGAVELFCKSKAKKLALVHICRKENVDVLGLEKIENVFIPEDLDVVEI